MFSVAIFTLRDCCCDHIAIIRRSWQEIVLLQSRTLFAVAAKPLSILP
ncbi:hypothetical protein [Pantoea sp. A4]|nr:hypothetical protein [Pantoea sp. A4]